MPNKSLQALRQVAASMAGLVPGVSDQQRKDLEDHFTRVLSGTASQVLGLNEQGEPELGARPGIVDEALALPKLAPPLLQGLGWVQDKTSLGVPFGDSSRRLAELAEKHMPSWADKAERNSAALREAVQSGVGLKDPRGFTENAEDALGVMAGQLPLPGSLVRKLTGGKGKAAKLAKTVAGSPVEWLSPTIDPKLSNYLSGAGFGGTIGSISDWLSGPPEEKAEGGRVDKLAKMLRSLSMNPEARKGSTIHHLEDPLENVKYASYEAAQSGKLSPESQASLNSLVEKYLNGDTSLTDEVLADQLIDLHRSMFGGPEMISGQRPNVIVPDPKKINPGAFGVLKR